MSDIETKEEFNFLEDEKHIKELLDGNFKDDLKLALSADDITIEYDQNGFGTILKNNDTFSWFLPPGS